MLLLLLLLMLLLILLLLLLLDASTSIIVVAVAAPLTDRIYVTITQALSMHLLDLLVQEKLKLSKI